MKCIEVDITDGHAKVTTSGFSGTECLKETAELERALGDVESVTKTAEALKPQRIALKTRA